VRVAAPPVLLAAALRRRARHGERAAAITALLALWSWTYARYRRRGRAKTQHEIELMQSATPEAFRRHYNESVPTIEEELDIWSDYHAVRHEMRYDLVADVVRELVPTGGTIVDIGCGAALVADRLADLPVTYVGLEYGGHQLKFAVDKSRQGEATPIRRWFLQGDAERLPIESASADVVVMSEVIEHLLRPDHAVWEVARILRPGGTFVMTTNNASEMPLRSPLSDPFSWLEKALGFYRDGLISERPWVWPEPVGLAQLPDGSEQAVFLPHTWHKQAETRRMFAAAGLETLSARTFEFPPPQSKTARWLSSRGDAATAAVDVLEAVCTRLPLVNRLGCHVFMVARRAMREVPKRPRGVWPGPFSD
jgi:ubiquinone/menaquinone biosynthesis C-methylase UbiE